ncbi:MAG: type II secretion system F family protein [Candidatus Omnitrophota bacterium]
MAVYIYKAKRNTGELLAGNIEAQTKEDALAKIASLDLFPISVEEKRSARRGRSRVSLKELIEFTQQLSTLINSGSPLLVSLNTLLYETEQLALNPILSDIVAQVKEGADFSQSLAKYPRVFPQLYVSLVRVGETSGTLGDNLKRISEFLEEEMDFRTNIFSIMTYPLIIVAVGLLTIFILLKFVIPKLVEIFNDIGQTLPFITEVIIRISNFFSSYWLFLLGLLAVFIFGLRRYFKSDKNRLAWDRFKLSLPLGAGDLLRKIEVCRLSRTLAVLLKNGVTIVSSLQVLIATLPNLYFREEIKNIEAAIKQGNSLSEAMKNTAIFNPAFINAVGVGEGAGKLDAVLENLSQDYNKIIHRKIKGMLTILEPLLILGVGLVVGLIVIAMLLPIFQIDFNF